MNLFFRQAARHFRKILLVYLLGIAFFTLFRLLLVLTNGPAVSAIGTQKWSLLARAFFMGWRFDTVIACYLLALPVVVLSVLFLFSVLRKAALRAIYVFIGLFFSIAFLACATDIPFFNYFFARLNSTVFNWTANAGFGVKMIATEPRYLVFALVFVGVVALYLWGLRRIYRSHVQVLKTDPVGVSVRQKLTVLPFVLVVFGLIFLGIRGRLEQKSPLHPGMAVFSNNAFINQLGLNPVFTLLRSTLDNQNPENQRFHKLDDAVALGTMARLLGADSNLKDVSPIARYETSEAPMQGRNVVLVMMESMSAAKMGRFGNKDNLTPFLDSLAAQCWSFDNTYSAGIHTYNGVYSTLFAHPAILHRHSMEVLKIPEMAGFPNVLKRNGYQSIFFTTHDEVFDNMSGFLTANGFDQIVGQKDYPAAEVKSTLGVPDEFMFRFAVPQISALAAAGKPFFAAFMTASDHGPYVIPENVGFQRRHKDDQQAVVAYADWSVRKFMEYAAAQSWYDSTVFVFVADHGGLVGQNAYDIAFSYHHIPFLIYAPGATPAAAFPQLGLQTDVFATVTSLVLPRFVNNTFSVNLRKTIRPYAVFSADTKLACLNDSLLYIWRTEADPGLYFYQGNHTENEIARYPALADSMQKIAFSWLQTSEWMLQNNKTKLP